MKNLYIISLLFIPVWSNSQDLSQFSLDKKFTLKGNISTNSSLFIKNNKIDWDQGFSANITIGLLGYFFPFSFHWNNRKRQFSEPFSQFKFAPSFGSTKLNIGTFSPVVSPYVLQGIQVRGIGVQSKIKSLHFHIVHGRGFNPIDTLDNENITHSTLKAGWSGKSLKMTGTIYQARKQSIFNELNKNTSGEVNINSFLGNLTSGDLRFSFSDFNQSNSSKESRQTFYSYETKWSIKLNNYQLGINYSRIDPGYNTFGINYINQDESKLSISGNGTSFQNRLQYRVEIGKQHNDLYGLSNTFQKQLGKALFIQYTNRRGLNQTINYNTFSSIERSKFTINDDSDYLTDSLIYIRGTKQITSQSKWSKTFESKNRLQSGIRCQQLVFTQITENQNQSDLQFRFDGTLDYHLKLRSLRINQRISYLVQKSTQQKRISFRSGAFKNFNNSLALSLSLQFNKLMANSNNSQSIAISSGLIWKPLEYHRFTCQTQLFIQNKQLNNRINLSYQININHD